MNDLGPMLLVLAAQITLPLAGGLLLSRRRDPAVACSPLILAALAVLLLTPLAFVPRPVFENSMARVSSVRESSAADAVPLSVASSPTAGIDLLQLFRLPKPESAPKTSTAFPGWSIVAYAMIGLAIFGLTRFLYALLSIVRVVRGSRPVTDASLQLLAAELALASGCRRPVDLRESSRVGSAATAGWLRPVVLVTPTWQMWSPAERRAVLAHEIAHVVRGDFRSRLVANLAAALHGYHPLVRWLAGRLELRQEIAADALAARSCGGSADYSKCLAALALRGDDRPIGLVPTFLTRPRTLLRRIAMLRVTDDIAASSRRWPAWAAIVLLAGLSLGIRGTTPASFAGPIVPAQFLEKKARPPLDASLVLPSDNADEVGVFAIRVGELCRTPGLETVADSATAMLPALVGDKKVRFALADIEQIAGRVSLTHDPKKPAPNHSLSMSLTVIRMAKGFDWPKQLQEWCVDWKEHIRAKTTYFSGKVTVPVLGFKDSEMWFYMPDARTVVLESEENIQKLIDAKGKPAAAAWAKDWHTVEGGMFAMMLPDVKGKLAKKLAAEKQNDKISQAIVKSVAAICAKSSRISFGIDLGAELTMRIRFACASGDDAKDVDEGCQALAKLAKAALADDAGDAKGAISKAGKTLGAELLESMTFRHGVDSEKNPALNEVELRMSSKAGVGEVLKTLDAGVGAK